MVKRREEFVVSVSVFHFVEGGGDVAGVFFDGLVAVNLIDVVPVREEPFEGAVSGIAPTAEAEEECPS